MAARPAAGASDRRVTSVFFRDPTTVTVDSAADLRSARRTTGGANQPGDIVASSFFSIARITLDHGGRQSSDQRRRRETGGIKIDDQLFCAS